MSGPCTSERIDRLPRSGIRGIMELALERPDVVRLDIGDPDFPTPSHIVEAAAEAARAGFTHYAPGVGLSSLHELIAGKVEERNGFPCEPERVAAGLRCNRKSTACGVDDHVTRALDVTALGARQDAAPAFW